MDDEEQRQSDIKKCLIDHFGHHQVEREIPVRGEGGGRVTKTINTVRCRICRKTVMRSDWTITLAEAGKNG